MAGSEEKTLAADESALYVQQKLREAADKRARRESGPVEIAMQKPAVPRAVVWGGAGGAALIAVVLVTVFWPRGETPPQAKSDPSKKIDEPAIVTTPSASTSQPVTVTSLAKSLKEGRGPARKEALDELVRRGAEANGARDTLIALLDDPDGEFRNQVRDTLAKLGPPLPDQLPLYATALRASPPAARLHAIRTIGVFGQQAKGELVLLRAMTLDDDPIVAESAEKAVATIQEDWMKSLLASLHDNAPNVRSKAVQQLAEMGPGAGPALPDLMEAMADKNPAVRTAVLDALHAIGPEAVAVLGESLRDKNIDVRAGAIYALGRMGPDARPVLPDLVAGVSDANARIRDETLKALERIGDYAVPYVGSALDKEKTPAKQKPYIEALGRLGPDAAPILARAVKVAQPDVKQVAVAAIKKIEEKPTAAPRKELTGTAGLVFADLRGWFNTADTNKDGYLDKGELSKAVLDTNAKSAAAAKKAATVKTPPKDAGKGPRFDLALPDDAAFLSRLDRDNDGKISRDEFDRWAYDYAEYTVKQLDEEKRIKEMQDRLREKELTSAMRLQTELAIQQAWANYHAYNRAMGQAAWLQRYFIARLRRR
jgi:HEAT repeat protein/Ca2+-binding EF-hand superfamily protein